MVDIHKEIDAIVKLMHDTMKAKGISFNKMEKLACVHWQTIHSWYAGATNPSLLYLIPVLDVLDLKLQVVKK